MSQNVIFYNFFNHLKCEDHSSLVGYTKQVADSRVCQPLLQAIYLIRGGPHSPHTALHENLTASETPQASLGAMLEPTLLSF